MRPRRPRDLCPLGPPSLCHGHDTPSHPLLPHCRAPSPVPSFRRPFRLSWWSLHTPQSLMSPSVWAGPLPHGRARNEERLVTSPRGRTKTQKPGQEPARWGLVRERMLPGACCPCLALPGALPSTGWHQAGPGLRVASRLGEEHRARDRRAGPGLSSAGTVSGPR